MNAKALVREWKHSVLQCILLLTVATFIDDSLRVVLNFDGHALIVVSSSPPGCRPSNPTGARPKKSSPAAARCCRVRKLNQLC